MRLFKVIFFFFSIFHFLFADVTIKASKSFIEDEPFVFSVTAVGNSVHFPNIDKIDGYKVQTISSNTSLININSNISEKRSKTFQLFPKKSFTIPSFLFEIDGQEYKTKSIQIEKKRIKKTNSKVADFTISSNKNEVYVGEEFKVKLLFKYSKELNVDALGLAKIDFENFWHKPLNKNSKRYELNGFIYQELEFLMFAQKSGELTIKPLRIDMNVIDNSLSTFSLFSNPSRVYKIYSNNLNISVKPLPNNLTLIGNFDIKATLDKNSINQGEAVSLKVEVDGFGNIEDLDDFKLQLKNATVYENKADIKSEIKDGKSYGRYIKVFSIIPSESLTLPSFKIEYFNSLKNKKVVKKSKSFKIEVTKLSNAKPTLVKPEVKQKSIETIVVTKSSLKDKIIYFIAGILVSLLIFGLYQYVIKSKKKKEFEQSPLLKKVRKSNSKDVLIKILVPYLGKDDSFDKKIFELEKSKSEEEFKNIKRELIKLVKDLRRGNESYFTTID